MGTLSTIALIILGISFMVFVTFFGRLPAFRHTPISFLHRVIWVHIPNGFLAIDKRLTSGRVTRWAMDFSNYIMYDKHPTVLIFFLLLLGVGEYLFLPTAWPRLNTLNKICGSIAILCPYVFLYLSVASDPGTIDGSNHVREMARYPYDFTLFHPGSVCYTCKLLKPARSKHCSVCKRCISRMDHHCIFINNCVGSENHHWFLLLLLSTGILTLYGGVLGTSLIVNATKARYPHWAMWPSYANGGEGMPWKQWLVIWSFGLQESIAMGSVTLLAVLTTPMVWMLLAYHLWLIYCGTTTNESMKWSDWQVEMDEGDVFKRKLPADRPKDLRLEPAWTRWPAEAEQIIVRTENGNPPREDLNIAGEGEWERMYKLRDVENLYDIGFWDNLTDVLRPGFMFRDGQTPLAEGRRKNRIKKKKRNRKQRAEESKTAGGGVGNSGRRSE